MQGKVIQDTANVLSKKQNKIDDCLTTTSKDVVGAINELNSIKQNKEDGDLTTDSKNVIDAINELNSKKQDKIDNNLSTSSKSVVGAINELNSKKSNVGHTHTKSQITDFPTSMPASDVYSWAKAPNKPSYTASEVGAAPNGHSHSLANAFSSGFMSSSDKIKLDGLSEGGGGGGTGGDGSYVHPSSHPASMITGLAKVSVTGDYNDLLNAPEPGSGGISIVNDLTTGGETAALSAEQGKILYSNSIAKHKKIKSGTPVDGIYPVVTWQRADGTKYKVSTLSGGTAPQWTTRTVVYYATNGTTIEKTDTFTISYDSDGNVLSEV